MTVNGQLARIFYVSPDEVAFVVPSGLANGPAQFLVTNSEGLSVEGRGNYFCRLRRESSQSQLMGAVKRSS